MIQTCPTCGRPAPRLLDSISREAYVNYYRCECGTVFNKPKDADGPIRVVSSGPVPAASETIKKP
jgi:hypothetical protein